MFQVRDMLTRVKVIQEKLFVVEIGNICRHGSNVPVRRVLIINVQTNLGAISD